MDDDAGLLEDWITIWQSELAAMVVDREQQETALRLVDLWAAQARAAVALMTPREPHDPARSARPDAASRPAALDAAPDGTATLERLRLRLAELDRRQPPPAAS